jgi:hypothetical protein
MVLQKMDCVLSGEEQQLKHNEHYLASMLSCSTNETELEQAERELDASLRCGWGGDGRMARAGQEMGCAARAGRGGACGDCGTCLSLGLYVLRMSALSACSETRGPSVGSQGLLPGLELLPRCSSSGYAAAARAHPIALLPAPG